MPQILKYEFVNYRQAMNKVMVSFQRTANELILI
jgi:hypothetical protein